MIKRAIEFATERHSSQKRKFSGLPYIGHPLSVMSIMERYTNDENILCASVLHDTVEDTDTSIEEIREKFGVCVANHVQALTSNTEEILSLGREQYDLYREGIKCDTEDLIRDILYIDPECSEERLIKYSGKALYLSRHLNSMDIDTLLIKLADRLDNVGSSGDESFTRLYKLETRYLMNSISRKDLTEKHNDLIKRIRNVCSC